VNAAASAYALGSSSGCAGYGVQAGIAPGVGGTGTVTPPTTTTTPTTTSTPTTTTPAPPPLPSPGPGPATPPVVTAAPTVTGPTSVGATLTASAGSWTGASTYQYGWSRCHDTCTPIAGASGSTYRLTPADRHWRLRVTVIAQNAAGSTAASSPPTALVR
jgi:hypothetical protein